MITIILCMTLTVVTLLVARPQVSSQIVEQDERIVEWTARCTDVNEKLETALQALEEESRTVSAREAAPDRGEVRVNVELIPLKEYMLGHSSLMHDESKPAQPMLRRDIAAWCEEALGPVTIDASSSDQGAVLRMSPGDELAFRLRWR